MEISNLLYVSPALLTKVDELMTGITSTVMYWCHLPLMNQGWFPLNLAILFEH